MKKILGILILSLIFSNFADAYSGKEAEQEGKIFVGMDKQEFCWRNDNWPCHNAKKKKRNKNKYPNQYYYDGKNFEILTTEDFRFYLFKKVTIPVWRKNIKTSIFNVKKAYGNGILISMHDSMQDAKEYMNKEILGLNEKERKEEEIAEQKKEQEEIMFTINDKREQCEAIGFKPETEKFADCVLRLVELDVKQQTQNQIAVAQNNGNDALVKQLKRQNNLQSSQALIDLGQQLMNPKRYNSNIYMPQTQRCTMQGFGTFATMRCR